MLAKLLSDSYMIDWSDTIIAYTGGQHGRRVRGLAEPKAVGVATFVGVDGPIISLRKSKSSLEPFPHAPVA
jgi:hypothetical protein